MTAADVASPSTVASDVPVDVVLRRNGLKAEDQ